MEYSKETINSMREDIKEGMSKNDIKKKYNCTEYVYLKASTPDSRKLTEEEKNEVIRLYYEEGKTKIELGNIFNTSYSIINDTIARNSPSSRRKIENHCKGNNVKSMSFDDIAKITDEIVSGPLTYDELAKKYNTSKGVIQNIATAAGNPRRGNYSSKCGKRKQVRLKEITSSNKSEETVISKKEEKKKSADIKFNTYHASIPTFSCGLSYSSKQMPVKDYIFKDNIKNIFDFSTLEQTIISFLNEHKVLVNGVVKQNLEVYNYGLPMCLTSLIKVCNENKINLTIYHYNQETYKYIPEIVFNQFGQSSNKFSGMFHQDQVNHDIYIQDKDDTEFDDSRFYIVRYKKNTTIDGYIFKDLGDLFNHLRSINDEAMRVSSKDFNISIFVEEGHIDNSKYVKDQVLYRIMNY